MLDKIGQSITSRITALKENRRDKERSKREQKKRLSQSRIDSHDENEQNEEQIPSPIIDIDENEALEICHKLNKNEYYKSKGFHFSVHENRTILIKENHNKILKTMSFPEAKEFLKTIEKREKPKKKGSLLNISC